MNKTLIVLSATSLLVAAIFGCGSTETKEPARRRISAPTFTVTPQSVLLARRFPGQVQAKNQTTLSSKLSGTVVRLSVDEGATVTAGTHLITIDDREVQQKLNGLEAERSAVARTRAACAAQAAYAQKQFRRMEELLQSAAATQEEYDRAQAEYEAHLQQERSLAEKEKMIAAQIAEIAALHSYAVIHAPLDGVVVRRHVDQGTFVTAGQPLIALDDTRAGFWFVAAIDEALLPSAADLPQVHITIPATHTNITTHITVIVPQIDPSSRTFVVKADIPTEHMRSGLYGFLIWPLGSTDRLLVPSTALVQRGDLTAVYTVSEDKTVHFRVITIGKCFQQTGTGLVPVDACDSSTARPPSDQWVEVLSGLSPQETIVTADVLAVAEGDVLQ